MTDLEKEAIKAYAEEGMNASRAAKKLYRHRNTVCFHLNNVHERTGLDPTNFKDLLKLYVLAGGTLHD